MFGYAKGRSGRKEYWASIGLLLLVGIGLALFDVKGGSAPTTFLWILVWGRRLHDIGRSTWYTLVPIGLMIAVCVGAFALDGHELADAFRYSKTENGPVTEQGMYIFLGLMIALLAIQIGFTVWLGVKAGDASDNRFGPPPKNLLAS